MAAPPVLPDLRDLPVRPALSKFGGRALIWAKAAGRLGAAIDIGVLGAGSWAPVEQVYRGTTGTS